MYVPSVIPYLIITLLTLLFLRLLILLVICKCYTSLYTFLATIFVAERKCSWKGSFLRVANCIPFKVCVFFCEAIIYLYLNDFSQFQERLPSFLELTYIVFHLYNVEDCSFLYFYALPSVKQREVK